MRTITSFAPLSIENTKALLSSYLSFGSSDATLNGCAQVLQGKGRYVECFVNKLKYHISADGPFPSTGELLVNFARGARDECLRQAVHRLVAAFSAAARDSPAGKRIALSSNGFRNVAALV